MSESLSIDVFVEDRAHEEFLRAMLLRLAMESEREAAIRVIVARGGHSRTLSELGIYQRVVEKGGRPAPDLLVVGVDANCTAFTKARSAVAAKLAAWSRDRAIIACPDPHIERWYLADPDSFRGVVGVRPAARKRKCERDIYKSILAAAVVRAGHPATLGGIEFAAELVRAMDLYRAGRAEASLKHFLREARAHLRRH
jgi:hypothetical protein